jgi:pyrroloquinoline-quinone synthase
MSSGALSIHEVQDWVLQRAYYQAQMPIKDALILSKMPREPRRIWIERITEQDGSGTAPGGYEEWFLLADGVGIDRKALDDPTKVVPGVRFAVDAYVSFCGAHSWQESVAASLTQLFASDLMRNRADAFKQHYGFTDPHLTYFIRHSNAAAREVDSAMDLLVRNLQTETDVEHAIAAVSFKCDVLKAFLDAVDAIR